MLATQSFRHCSNKVFNLKRWCTHLIRLENIALIKVKMPQEISLMWQISPQTEKVMPHTLNIHEYICVRKTSGTRKCIFLNHVPWILGTDTITHHFYHKGVHTEQNSSQTCWHTLMTAFNFNTISSKRQTSIEWVTQWFWSWRALILWF